MRTTGKRREKLRIAAAGTLLAMLLAGCQTGAVTEVSPSPSQQGGTALQTWEEETAQPGISALPSAPAQEEPLGFGQLQYDGVEELTQGQEELLLEYMDLYFESLARLTVLEAGELFSDEEAARADRALVSQQVELRLAQEADDSLVAYRYTLTCGRAETNGAGQVELFAVEDSVQNFAQHPEVDSERYNVYHLFTLEETAEGWRIASHVQVDSLYLQLWREDRMGLEAYLSESPAYLQSLLDGQAQRIAQRGLTAETLAADHAYDRAAAAAYALEYATVRNDRWPDYSGSGGNCQNFASQCLLAGGVPMDTVGDAVWKWYDGGLDNGGGAEGRSSSWASVSAFRSYVANNSGYGLVAQLDAPYFTGEVGDLIHMGSEDAWRHTVVITQPVVDGAGNVVDYLVCSNTKDLRNFPANLYGYARFSLTKVAGWNVG